MTRAFKCDCCGKYYDKNRIKAKNFSARNITVKRIDFVCDTATGYVDESFDLCDECLTKVYELLGRNKKENSENEEK